jgi:NADH dehydrogenase (ubiquinone) 1 alpha subcomplex subunit 12
MDEMKAGTLVGADKYGNRYFEDPTQFYGRNRWVEYADYKNLEYDGSQIPAEWFGWMHYKVCIFKVFNDKSILNMCKF